MFVPISDIQRSVDDFLRRHRSSISAHTEKINQYAEITTFNAVVQFYESLHYRARATGLVGDKFKYKLQPTGDPRNYSSFLLERGGKAFRVLTNISLESAHVTRHYFSSDIAVVDEDSLAISDKASNAVVGIGRSTFAIPNAAIRSFIEVKNLPAFPELLFSFSGLLFEIMPDVFFGRLSKKKPAHLAPSLVCSFAGSGHASFIRNTLLSRWHINIFVDFLRIRKLSATGGIRMLAGKRLKFPTMT